MDVPLPKPLGRRRLSRHAVPFSNNRQASYASFSGVPVWLHHAPPGLRPVPGRRRGASLMMTADLAEVGIAVNQLLPGGATAPNPERSPDDRLFSCALVARQTAIRAKNMRRSNMCSP